MKENQKKILQLCIVLLFLSFTSWGQIKVYTMDGCGRCKWTVNYLKENKIPFTELNTTKDEKNNQEMWDLLSKNGGTNGSITMPVVDNNGAVAYSIPDLEDYVAKLNTKGNSSSNNNSINTKSGIRVYTMDGCGRCSWTVKYLKENKIPFTELNTTKDDKNNQEMWDLLSKNGGANGSITMPVVDNNGAVAYSIPDLEDYVAKLNTKENTTNTNTKPEIIEEKQPTKKKKIIPSKLKKNG